VVLFLFVGVGWGRGGGGGGGGDLGGKVAGLVGGGGGSIPDWCDRVWEGRMRQVEAWLFVVWVVPSLVLVFVSGWGHLVKIGSGGWGF